MAERIVAKKLPYKLQVEQGQTYYWCSCGRSKNQPLCDGSHEGTGNEPVAYVAEETEMVFFCGCKATKNEPMCDSSHGTVGDVGSMIERDD